MRYYEADGPQKSDLVDIELFRHAESDRAVLFSEFNVKSAGKWLPKSQIEYYKKEGPSRGDAVYVVTMPKWLAKDKGFV